MQQAAATDLPARPPGGKRLRVVLAVAAYVLAGARACTAGLRPTAAPHISGIWRCCWLHVTTAAACTFAAAACSRHWAPASAFAKRARCAPRSAPPASRAGVPVWWWLTSLHRPPLPLDTMRAAAGAPPASLPVTVEAYALLPGGERHMRCAARFRRPCWSLTHLPAAARRPGGAP